MENVINLENMKRNFLVVGVVKFNYKNKEGKEIPSVNLHCCQKRTDTMYQKFEGLVTMKSIYMKEDKYNQICESLGLLTLQGLNCDLVFNQYGGLDYILC